MKKEDVYIFLADRNIELLVPMDGKINEPSTALVWMPDNFGHVKNEVINLTYPELTNKGMVVVARKPDTQWYKGQKYAYFIVYTFMSQFENVVNRLPADIGIEYDKKNNVVRLTGRSAGKEGYGLWIPILE